MIINLIRSTALERRNKKNLYNLKAYGLFCDKNNAQKIKNKIIYSSLNVSRNVERRKIYGFRDSFVNGPKCRNELRLQPV